MLTLLLTIALGQLPADAHHPEAVEVYSCDFGPAADVNHDRWPDHWRRRRSAEYPTYLPIEIVDDPAVADKRIFARANGWRGGGDFQPADSD